MQGNHIHVANPSDTVSVGSLGSLFQPHTSELHTTKIACVSSRASSRACLPCYVPWSTVIVTALEISHCCKKNNTSCVVLSIDCQVSGFCHQPLDVVDDRAAAARVVGR